MAGDHPVAPALRPRLPELVARVGRTAIRAAGILVVVSTCAAAPAQAQPQAEVLQPGQRVRVSLDCSAPLIGMRAGKPSECPKGGQATGTLVRLSSDTLVLETTGSAVEYSLAAISRIEASRRRTSRWKLGGVVGFVGGTAATFAVLNSGSPGSTNRCDPQRNQDAIGGTATCLSLAAVAGGVPGALLGMFVGSRLRTDQWEAVPRPRIGVTLLPFGPRRVLSVSLHLR